MNKKISIFAIIVLIIFSISGCTKNKKNAYQESTLLNESVLETSSTPTESNVSDKYISNQMLTDIKTELLTQYPGKYKDYDPDNHNDKNKPSDKYCNNFNNTSFCVDSIRLVLDNERGIGYMQPMWIIQSEDADNAKKAVNESNKTIRNGDDTFYIFDKYFLHTPLKEITLKKENVINDIKESIKFIIDRLSGKTKSAAEDERDLKRMQQEADEFEKKLEEKYSE